MWDGIRARIVGERGSYIMRMMMVICCEDKYRVDCIILIIILMVRHVMKNNNINYN